MSILFYFNGLDLIEVSDPRELLRYVLGMSRVGGLVREIEEQNQLVEVFTMVRLLNKKDCKIRFFIGECFSQGWNEEPGELFSCGVQIQDGPFVVGSIQFYHERCQKQG